MRRALEFLALLAAFGLVGLVVVVSGIVPIKASSGHWAVTRWFLQFAKERSIATQSLAIQSPPLDERWLVLKGAGHYEIGCRPCHGSPGERPPRIAQHMLPPPPDLAQTNVKWKRAELFSIIKHGLKFTGMPAWPSAQRDDEVWAVVAFLEAYSELDAQRYRRLVNGELPALTPKIPLTDWEGQSAVAQSLLANCQRCHGADGLGRDIAAFPKLAGQSHAYLIASLEAYARGERHSGIMEPIAAGLSSTQIRELAHHYSTMNTPAMSSPQHDSAQAIERGEVIVQWGLPDQDVPACIACHDPGTPLRNPTYPLLDGQHADYLALQLTLFRQDHRGGTSYAPLMRRVAADLSVEQLRDVATYYAAQVPHAPR